MRFPAYASLPLVVALLGGPVLSKASPSSSRPPEGAPAHPLAGGDYFGRRLAEAVAEHQGRRGAQNEYGGGEEEDAVTATAVAAPVTCDEGYDDDATLAAIPLAKEYGLSTCKTAHTILVSFDAVDMLCKSMAVGVCNCTCAGTVGTVVTPSIKVQSVPYDQAEDLSPARDDAFDCADIAANDGEKNAKLLPADVKGWKNCHPLGEVGVLLWNVDEEGETIAFAAEFVSAGGAAALGLSSNGGMYGADLLWVGKDEEATGDDAWVVKDMFSRGYSSNGDLVTLDESQDATLDWSEEADGRLAFRVSRAVKSCDTEDDLEILAGPIPILWARFSGHSHMYHGPNTDDRGTVYLDLLNPHNEGIPESPEDLYTVDLRFNHGDNTEDNYYELEDGRVNSYVCRSFELPSDRPYHIVSYEAILDTVPVDTNVVHHVVLYSCEDDPNLPDPHLCTAMNAGCYSVDIAWAVGIPPQHLPAVAGLPMGKFYYMEMHYENIAQVPGIKDGSGLRLTFTPELREQDYGYVIVGSSIGGTPDLEPGRDDLVRSGFCPSECTARSLPADGVTVHSMFFHSHLAGRSLRTQQLRDGKELQPLGDMPYYDFNHQFFKYASHQPKLLPGDELVTTCHYSTTDADGPTTFGLETNDEMCFNIVGVYPAFDMKYCWNETQGGGRCWYGDDAEVTEGIVPYVPFEEDVPERCSADDGDAIAGSSSSSSDGIPGTSSSSMDGDAVAGSSSSSSDGIPGTSSSSMDEAVEPSDDGKGDGASARSSSAERTPLGRLILSALVLVQAKLMV